MNSFKLLRIFIISILLISNLLIMIPKAEAALQSEIIYNGDGNPIQSIAIDSNDTIYIGNHTYGSATNRILKKRANESTWTDITYNYPADSEVVSVAVDGFDNIYVSSRSGAIYKKSANDTEWLLVTTYGPQTNSDPWCNEPTSYLDSMCMIDNVSQMKVDGAGNIYLVDAKERNKIAKLPVNSSDWEYVYAPGYYLHGFGVDDNETIYIVDMDAQVQKKTINSSNWENISGNDIGSYVSGKIYLPQHMSISKNGDIYLSVQNNSTNGSNLLKLTNGSITWIDLYNTNGILFEDIKLDSQNRLYTKAYTSSGWQLIKLIDTTPTPTSIPTVVTVDSASNITTTVATVGGDVTADGGATISERGIVYGTTANPTVDNSKKTATGTTGAFTANLTGLTANTTYYYRAYATNSNGTSYGTDQTFTTLANATNYTVTYDGNGSTGGSVPTDSNSYTQGSSVTVQGNTGSLVRTGYTFAGWNTVADGSGTNYLADATFDIGSTNVTLYAKWQQNQAPTSTILIEDQSVNVSETTINVPVVLTPGLNVTAKAFSFDFSYDATKLTLKQVKVPTTENQSITLDSNAQTNGKIRVIGSYSDLTPLAGTVAILEFTKKSELAIGQSTIDLSNIVIGDGNTLPSNQSDSATITVTANTNNNLSSLGITDAVNSNDVITLDKTFSVDTTAYTANKVTVGNKITLSATSEDSSAIISYKLNGEVATNTMTLRPGKNTIEVTVTAQDGTTAKTYTISILIGLKGDADGNGVVNINDWTKIVDLILNRETPSAQAIWNADMNNDKSIDINDWVRIAEKLLSTP